MILARPIAVDRQGDLELAFRRMGLSDEERARLRVRLPHAQLLVTGLSPNEQLVLKGCCEERPPGGAELPWVSTGAEGTALLSGRREQLERLSAVAREEGFPELAAAVEHSLAADSPPPPLELPGRSLVFGRRTYLMGVVNVTPDSFSDGGRFLEPSAAIAHGRALAQAGADLLDVGGESTRPGARRVSAEEELSRVLPVVRGLLEELPGVPISVDTTKSQVARQVLAAGAAMINDISGFHFDPELPRVVAEAGAACSLMHIRGTPETMQQEPRYQDLIAEVLEYLGEAIASAEAAGIDLRRIVVDPGVGFGKTVGHNLYLLRRISELRVLGRPILLGTSRKSFLGQLTGGKPPVERVAATLGSLAAVAVNFGADLVRVHDLPEAKDALAIAEAIRSAEEGGELPRGS